jgi:hypothetical protein
MIDVMGSVLCLDKLLQMCTVFCQFRLVCYCCVVCVVLCCVVRKKADSSFVKRRGLVGWVPRPSSALASLPMLCLSRPSARPVLDTARPPRKENGLTACLQRVLRPSLLRILRIPIPHPVLVFLCLTGTYFIAPRGTELLDGSP